MDPRLLQTLTLLRLVAFMVLLYLALGLLAERFATRPDSKVRAFFRTLCSPVTRPVSRLLPSGSGERRVLSVSIGLVASVWIALIVATELGR